MDHTRLRGARACGASWSHARRGCNRGGRAAGTRGLLRGWSGSDPLALVTHQVNITALTGVFPASGEALLVYTGARAGTVALRVPPPAV